MKRISVKIQPDFLATVAKVKKPILAIAELIWNGLDAEASVVKVIIDKNELGAVDQIRVLDNGCGIEYDNAIPEFGNLGGSWKRGGRKTKFENRLMHGRYGRGRFFAFHLGQLVEWNTSYHKNGSTFKYKILGDCSNIKSFQLGDEKRSRTKETGTEVIISNLNKNFPSILGENAIKEITEQFALYLLLYKGTQIFYDGVRIKPLTLHVRKSDYKIGSLKLTNGRVANAELTIIEWRDLDVKTLYLCDKGGFALEKIPPGIKAPNFNFTAYLKSETLKELNEDKSLYLEDMNPDLRIILDNAKDILREHFRKRAEEEHLSVIEEWKKEEIYPYVGEVQGIIEKTTREVFDICALSMDNSLPEFAQSDRRSKKFILQMLRQTLEDNPESVPKILHDVLDLTRDKQDELATLLKKTTLSAIINASKEVADRLDFLKGLDILLFDKNSKEELLERSQLQKILSKYAWLFDERYNLLVDDQSLTHVLKQHINILGRDEPNPEPVLSESGKIQIVDFMFSGRISPANISEREHLIVEIKRPRKKIDRTVLQQIEDYAATVAGDERFREGNPKWIFWAISNDITDGVRLKTRQKDWPIGLVGNYESPNLKIWVKTWGQIIDECRTRLSFYQEQLEYNADRDSALEYLRKTHAKYLPDSLAHDALIH